jgi:hypothetical protein
MRDGVKQVVGQRRRLVVGLLWAWMTTGCVESAQDSDTEGDTEDAELRVDEWAEPMDLYVESSSLIATNGKPSYAACPACGRVVARGQNFIDVDVMVPGHLGYTGLMITLDQEDIIPATIEWSPTSMNIVGSIRLRTQATIRSKASVLIWGRLPNAEIVPFTVEE